jgi:hypothetical protein
MGMIIPNGPVAIVRAGYSTPTFSGNEITGFWIYVDGIPKIINSPNDELEISIGATIQSIVVLMNVQKYMDDYVNETFIDFDSWNRINLEIENPDESTMNYASDSDSLSGYTENEYYYAITIQIDSINYIISEEGEYTITFAWLMLLEL